MTKFFDILKFDDSKFQQLSCDDRINSKLLTKVLATRHELFKSDLTDLFDPNLESMWDNPYEILGMDQVANCIEDAVRSSKNILVYGDYDLDGMSATSIMVLGLKKILTHCDSKSKIDYFIPDRFSEGYGFSPQSVNRLIKEKKDYNFIVTVDCGITANKEITYLKQYGYDIVVTDHHEKSNDFPDNVALIDPKAKSQFKESDPNEILCGAAVALKLLQALCSRFGFPYLWQEFIDLATLGTIADMMPLFGQNRALVFEGLKMINNSPRVAIRAIFEIIGKKLGSLSSVDLSFLLCPRLNSAGRMNFPSIGVELLTQNDYETCHKLALELENLNTQRKLITDDVANKAIFQAENTLSSNKLAKSICVYDSGWHEGVIGIVAAKISNKYCLPTIVFNLTNDFAHGSGRSVGQIDIHDALCRCSDMLFKFGGHKIACGLTVKISSLEKFCNEFENYMQDVNPSMFTDLTHVDAKIDLSEINFNEVSKLKVLEPYGTQNTEPVFLTENVFLKNCRAVGKDKNHLMCTITDGVNSFNGIYFNCPDIANINSTPLAVCIAYCLKIEDFKGVSSIKLHIKKIVTSKELLADNSDDTRNIIYENENDDSFTLDCENDIATDFYDCSQGDRSDFSKLDKISLRRKLLDIMVGVDAQLHSSQTQTLDVLDSGFSALAVLPTGRGKSLIFQIYASEIAIKHSKMSLFVYPLRALISDQSYHLSNCLSKLGLNSCVLCGQTAKQDREKIYQQASSGDIDILLTTPEFLQIHIDKIANACDIGFIVIDECHHLGEVKIGSRTAYGCMPEILKKLNRPQVLALSATVNKSTYQDIKKYLPIQKLITDNYERENLFIDDKRNIKYKDDYLTNLCASGQKIVIYVNSRAQSVELSRMIKSKIPHKAMQIAFYNAAMTKKQRKYIENAFRENVLSVLIATSAFGEGVNIPDIRHVCLYHLPFSEIEFNQMSGRAGRDGLPAIVHLLYNVTDSNINNNILLDSNPDKNRLAKIYIWIRENGRKNSGHFDINSDEIDTLYEKKLVPCSLSALQCVLTVFEELNLVSIVENHNQDHTIWHVEIINQDKKVNLEESSRYIEGQNQITTFEKYKNQATQCDVLTLTQILRHPISPQSQN